MTGQGDDQNDEKDDEPVPRLPRGRFLHLTPERLVGIFGLVITLIAVLALRQGCSQGVGRLFESFEEKPARSPMQKP